jgi:hypothetical protein
VDKNEPKKPPTEKSLASGLDRRYGKKNINSLRAKKTREAQTNILFPILHSSSAYPEARLFLGRRIKEAFFQDTAFVFNLPKSLFSKRDFGLVAHK